MNERVLFCSGGEGDGDDISTRGGDDFREDDDDGAVSFVYARVSRPARVIRFMGCLYQWKKLN